MVHTVKLLKRRDLALAYSFTRDIVNPITDARLQKSFSGPALAKRLGLSRQYLNRAEQGTYTAINPALQKWVANALQIHPDAVRQRYILFQKAQRCATVEKIEPHKLERHGSSEAGHLIFERWRNGYWTSPTQFAVAFCVHPDAVQKYEEGIQKKMPDALRNALTETNLIEINWADEIEPCGVEATGARLTA